MKIFITGAGGFVGQLLAEHLLNASHDVILTDIFQPAVPPGAAQHASHATCIQADLSTSSANILTPDLDAIYIFHGIMSAGAEADFSLGYRVNLFSTLTLLDAIRTTCAPTTRVIYASSTAIFGQPLPAQPDENTVPTPQGSYGAQKAMVEFAINDYTRRGFFNGFALRFPTISVRPGKPTQAASSWMSGVIREPLQGVESVCPCADEFQVWVSSPRTLVRNLLHVLTLERGCLPAHVRQVLLPGITTDVKGMLEALREVGGEQAVGLVRRERGDEEIMKVLESWPTTFDVSRALGLGFVRDERFVDAVRDFAEGLGKGNVR